MSWAESHEFQGFIIGVIGFNAIVMGLEADYPDIACWYYIEQILLAIFCFELVTRLKHWEWYFFVHPHDFKWNWLDFLIVVGGVMDMWMLPCYTFVRSLLGSPVKDSHKL